ncbi:MAG: 50S ribosomal protein L15 [Candidatus Buchananbacteria bacterium]|nr:50S ribosomal protein L15 [Candidatus Buchananbacteria bacterium]
MNLTLSNLKPAQGSTKRRKRVGRGGKRGSYSGKGMKGQKARSGGRSGLKALGFKQTMQRVPKSRGFKSLKAKLAVVNLSDLDKIFKEGDKVTAKELIKTGLITSAKNGVKVLGSGKLSKKISVSANAFSASAKAAIEKAGGQAEIIVK